SRHRGKALLAGFAGTMIPASTGIGMASMIKSVPIAGSAIGAMTTPALAVAATYAIGLAFVEHFASGGTLLDFDPPDYQEFIKGGVELRKTLTFARACRRVIGYACRRSWRLYLRPTTRQWGRPTSHISATDQVAQTGSSVRSATWRIPTAGPRIGSIVICDQALSQRLRDRHGSWP